jgi:multidrug efflux pump subunit AcrA (membrane-fusion protein)
MDHDGLEFSGKIVSISEVVDAATGLYKIEVQADDNSLLPPNGSSVNIITVARQSKNVLTVPENSIYYDGEQAYVYVQDGDKAKRSNITTGLMEDGNVEVIEGLISDDKVIVSWNSNMKDGAGIKVK